MLSNPTPAIARDADINHETLIADLRERARLARALARRRSDQIDALYLDVAANEIERLRIALKEQAVLYLNPAGEIEPDVLAEQHGIIVIDTLEARPDDELGHALLNWPLPIKHVSVADWATTSNV